MTTSPETKRPDTRGNAVEPGSSANPAKGKPMSDTDTTTPAARQAQCDKPDINMESILHDIHNMADVTAELLGEALGSSHEHVTGHRDKYHLTGREIERLLFCAYQTEMMARNAIESYLKSAGLGQGGDA